MAQIKQGCSGVRRLPRAAFETDDLEQGKAQLFQVLRRSRSRQEWADAAAALCLGRQLEDAAEYAKTMEEACCFRKLWVVALATLKEMRDRGVSRNASVYLAAIRSCGKSAWRRALFFLDDMTSDGMEQGLVSHKAVLKVLEHAGRWQEVLAMLKSMQTKGLSPGLEDYSLALRVCSNSSRNAAVTEAVRANLDAFMYQDQIELCRQDEWQTVLHLVEDMTMRDLFPDKAMCSSAINILEYNSLWVEALELLAKSQKRGYPRDGVLYGASIRCCLRNERLEEAIALMKEAMETELRPDMETYEALVLTCNSMGYWKWALFLWKDMLQTKVGQQTAYAVHESIMEACQAAGEWKWVLALLNDMEKVSMEPSMKAYRVALSACRKAEKWNWVAQLEQKLVLMEKAKTEMHDRPVALVNVEPGDVEEIYSSLQSCADGSWEVALQLLRALQGRQSQPDGVAFNSVISACRRGGEIQKALALMEEMQEEKLDPDSEIYNELVSALEPDKAKETPAAIRQSWSMTPGSFRIIRSPQRKQKAPSRKGRRPRSSDAF